MRVVARGAPSVRKKVRPSAGIEYPINAGFGNRFLLVISDILTSGGFFIYEILVKFDFSSFFVVK